MTDKQIEELENAIGAQPDIDKYIKMAYSGYQDEEIYDENDFNIATADWWVKACEHESARAERWKSETLELLSNCDDIDEKEYIEAIDKGPQ